MKYLAVDLGNVICSVDFRKFKDLLSKSFNISLDDAEYFLIKTQQLHDLGISNMENELRDHFKIISPVIIKEFLIEWNQTVKPHAMMIQMLESMINDGVNIALLSNIGMDHAAIMQQVLGPTIFNKATKFFSCEVGARKPSLLYYKTFLDMYPTFKGCLYIDDREENIAIGNKMGLNSIHFALDKSTFVDLTDNIEKIKNIVKFEKI